MSAEVVDTVVTVTPEEATTLREVVPGVSDPLCKGGGLT